jgi:hypothetical protein
VAIETPEDVKRRIAAEDAEREARREADLAAQIPPEQKRLGHLGVQVKWSWKTKSPAISLACPYCGRVSDVASREIQEDGSTDARCQQNCGDLGSAVLGEAVRAGPHGLYCTFVFGVERHWDDAAKGAPLDRTKFERELATGMPLVERQKKATRRWWSF